jgi:hypothetical protein
MTTNAFLKSSSGCDFNTGASSLWIESCVEGSIPKIEDSSSQPLDKNQCPRVPVSRDKDAALLSGNRKQPFATCLGEPDPTDLSDIVAQFHEEPRRRRINVLIDERLHVEVAVR